MFGKLSGFPSNGYFFIDAYKYLIQGRFQDKTRAHYLYTNKILIVYWIHLSFAYNLWNSWVRIECRILRVFFSKSCENSTLLQIVVIENPSSDSRRLCVSSWEQNLLSNKSGVKSSIGGVLCPWRVGSCPNSTLYPSLNSLNSSLLLLAIYLLLLLFVIVQNY